MKQHTRRREVYPIQKGADDLLDGRVFGIESLGHLVCNSVRTIADELFDRSSQR